MNINQLCMKCMIGKLNEEGKCTSCGATDSSEKNGSLHLPVRSILKGKYLIGRVIGEGGFGITYIGFDLDLEIRVAIKEFCPKQYVGREAEDGLTIYPYNEKDAEFFENEKQKFINEARRLAKFRNEGGVVSVLDYFIENGTAYIVMDYIDGITLKSYLKTLHNTTGKNMTMAGVLNPFRPVMETLAKIHNANIIHRDISPENIMISKDFTKVYLIDFGTARDIEDGHTLSEYSKSFYTPIEQMSDKMKQGPWTDVYALCATIYVCITGRTLPESVSRLLDDDLIEPRKHGADISESVEAVLIKGLAVKPEDRIQSMEELMQAFYVESSAEEETADALVKETVINPEVTPMRQMEATKQERIESVNEITKETAPTLKQSEKADTEISSTNKKKTEKIGWKSFWIVALAIILLFVVALKNQEREDKIQEHEFRLNPTRTDYDGYNSVTGEYYSSYISQMKCEYDEESGKYLVQSEELLDGSRNLIESRKWDGEKITYSYENGETGIFQTCDNSEYSTEEYSWMYTLLDSSGRYIKIFVWDQNLVIDTEFTEDLAFPSVEPAIKHEWEYDGEQLVSYTDSDSGTGLKTVYEYDDNKRVEKVYDIYATEGTGLLTTKEFVDGELTASYEHEDKGVKIDLLNNVKIVPWASEIYGLEECAWVESIWSMDGEALEHTYKIRGITEENIILHCDGDYRLISVEGDEEALWENVKARVAMRVDEVLKENGYSGVTHTEEMDVYAEIVADACIRKNLKATTIDTGYYGKGKHLWWVKDNPVSGIGGLGLGDDFDYTIPYKRIGVAVKKWNDKWLIAVALYD